MALYGAIVGGPDHYWYKYIDKWLPGTNPQTVAKKVVLDTFIYGPPHIATFYIGEKG